jgi:hypothetical protein
MLSMAYHFSLDDRKWRPSENILRVLVSKHICIIMVNMVIMVTLMTSVIIKQGAGTNMLIRKMVQIMREAMSSMSWTSEMVDNRKQDIARSDDNVRKDLHTANVMQMERSMGWNR